MKTSLSILPGKTSLDTKVADLAAQKRKELRSKAYAKRSSRPLPEIEVGSKVFVQDHEGRKRWKRQATVLSNNGPRGYTIRLEDGSTTTRNRVHLHPTTPIDTPDGWTENDLDAVDPDLGATENPDHECSDSDEESAPQMPQLSAAEPPALRRSARTNKGQRYHSCSGCHRITNYLNVIDSLDYNDGSTSHQARAPS